MIQSARTYNQNHISRPAKRGARRVSIYWSWSYPWESNRDLTGMDNRFSTMTEVRRVGWPNYETAEWNNMNFLQGIAGTLELFHRSTLDFQKVVEEVSGHSVAVFQRIDQAGFHLPIDERILADTDTLMIFGLDHLVADLEASAYEVECIREWLKREGTCLLIGPHHDVGFTEDDAQKQMEYLHHGDELVPRQQRFSQYTRSLIKHLSIPVINQFGLRPARTPGTKQIAPLTINHDSDTLGLFKDVTTFNFHPHLPHYALTSENDTNVQVLSKQPIDLDRPHPFTLAGNTELNACLWLPPSSERAGNILMVDSTNFTTLFGGTDSLKNFWSNLARM